MKKRNIIILSLVSAGVALILQTMVENVGKPLLERYGLQGLPVKEIISRLEDELHEPAKLKASITATKLTLSDDKDQVALDMPEEFYISIAPYIEKTHPCANHSLISCRGELKNETFYVEVRDSDTGEAIIDETFGAASNGFMGVWLPRYRDFDIAIAYGDLSASTRISTGNLSDTCLTTLRLS